MSDEARIGIAAFNLVLTAVNLFVIVAAYRRIREDRAREEAQGWQTRIIWFWQQDRYLRDGWSVASTSFIGNPVWTWPLVAVTNILRHASRPVQIAPAAETAA